MRVHHQRLPDGTPCLCLEGRLDAGNRESLTRAIRSCEGDCVSLDLAETEGLDLAGVGALIMAMRELRSRGRSLRITALSPAVARVLQLLNLSWLREQTHA